MNFWRQLATIGDVEVACSDASLSQKTDRSTKELIGYSAEIKFHVVLKDLAKTEKLIVGVIEAGANEVAGFKFDCSNLSALRNEVRGRAIAAARSKAEGYCKAANVELGEVFSIEDRNPDRLSANKQDNLHVSGTPEVDDEGDIRAFNPTSIAVAGSVNVIYLIASD